MDNKENILARKYAQAFFNCYHNDIALPAIQAIETLQLFLANNQRILFFLSLSHISEQIKKDFLRTLFQEFKVPNACNELARVLIDSKRGQLLYLVLTHLVMIYKYQTGIESFIIQSSHPLSEEQIATIKQFLARIGGCDIMYTYTVDPSLIAGLRLQSDTKLWEYSINKQLNSINQ